MKNKVLVSVVVPVYNVENYVGKCLKSLINQDYDEVEIIVVDDGSTDGSGEICDEMAKTDNRVKVFHRKNGGLSDARNYGIKKSNGKYIALVDGDDFVKERYIGLMVSTMEKNNVDVVICGYNDVRPKERIISGEDAVKRLLIKQENIDIVAWNKLYKKDLFIKNDIWYPVGEKHEDALTTYKILARTREVAYVSDDLYVYVKRDGSIMRQADEYERLKIRERAAEEAVNYFSDKNTLGEVAKISLLTAKFAFVDAGLKNKINQEYIAENVKWILEHIDDYKNSKYLTGKLKLYLKLMRLGHGKGYFLFRKIV